MSFKGIKSELLEQCSQILEKRRQKVDLVINDIMESLYEESKNTAGDKHETNRAMLQIDRENAGKQLQEIEALQLVLRKIDISAVSDYIRLGSLVYTTKGIYFISISVGAVIFGKTTYYCVALHSPIGEVFMGKKKGDIILFNQKEMKITSIM